MAKKKTKVFAVFGLSSFGKTIATVLAEKGGEVIVVDNDRNAIETAKNLVTAAILINFTDEEAIAKAPLEDVETAIIAIDNMETSIVTTAILKKRGIPYIVCRSVSDIHAQVLRQIGANEVINLQEDEGRRIATRLIAPEILDTIPITSESSLAEFYVPDMFLEKELGTMHLQEKFSIHLAGLKRTEISVDSEGNPVRKENLLFPEDSEILKDGDILILVGKNIDLEQLRASV